MSLLTKEQIFAAKDIQTEDVDLTKWWGGSVRLKSLTGHGRDNFEQKCVNRRKGKDNMDLRGLKVALLALTIVDTDGKLMFTEKELHALNNKAAAPINLLFEKAQEMNGLGEDIVKELEGNSESALNE